MSEGEISLTGEISIIGNAIRDGTCVLFTGPGLALTDASNGTRSINQEVTAKLRAKLNRPQDVAEDAPFAHVAQVYLMESPDRLRPNLHAILREEIKAYQGQTTNLHKELAKLPFRLCLTTTVDGFLEVAFRKEGKRPASGFLDYSKGAPGLAELTNDPQEPFLYRLYGSFEREKSLVLTEDDQIKYLINVVKRGFPGDLVEILKDPETVFLFLGFGLYQWHLRVLLRILDQSSPREYPSFAHESGALYPKGPRSDFNSYALGQAKVFYKYGRHRILLSDDSLEAFVKKIAGEFGGNGGDEGDGGGEEDGTGAGEAEKPPVPPRSAAKVFLSYTRADEQKVLAVEECLNEAGFHVLRDRSFLEGGDNFEEKIFSAMKASDYFVFAESRNTEPPDVNKTVKIKSWWRREVKEALNLSKDFPFEFKFLIPIRIEDCRMPTELQAIETIDFFGEDGGARLVSAIKKDWQLRRRERPDRALSSMLEPAWQGG